MSDRAALLAALPAGRCSAPRLLRRFLPPVAAAVLLMVLYLTYYLGQHHVTLGMQRSPPLVRVSCGGARPDGETATAADGRHRTAARLKLEPKVLLFLETQYSQTGHRLTALLAANGFRYKTVTSASLPIFTSGNRGKYSVVVFESYAKYLAMDAWNRAIIDKYCKDYDVGIVAFMPTQEDSLHGAELTGSGLRIHTNLALQDARLEPDSPVLRIARAGEVLHGPVPGDVHTVFVHNHSSYRPVMTAVHRRPEVFGGRTEPLTLVVQDCGYHDGIRRLLFGVGPEFWLSGVLLLDAMSYLSHGALSGRLERLIMVDVDDIFVGRSGIRMKPDDVQAMVDCQERIRQLVPGFTFNLGYCGQMLHTGDRQENAGDDALLAAADRFWWFPHIWSHKKPHTFGNRSAIVQQMKLNKQFAVEHRLPVRHQYAVAPHHSGVYPVNDDLYDAWREVWNIRQTSTEEYPHLYPPGQRQGFVYKGVRVLPRQTCGLFTHTIFIDKYPGGRQALDDKIQGGEIFQTLLHNPISIFMTHLSNYGNDRLGLYTFESVVQFVRCWTHLRLRTEPPEVLADKYFELHPEQRSPVWGNPCRDRRHLSLWRPAVADPAVCRRFPRLLVLGPQKTGSTALLSFLRLHPAMTASRPSPRTFEEVQFFSGDNYLNGIDWYLEFFPSPNNESVYLFEKSATYFDGEQVPRRVKALLPDAKLVAILISPAARAYSWYQHQRAHQLPAALRYTFYQVVSANNQSERSLRQLRNRCLEPGKYAAHLEAWLHFFPPSQIHVVDGDQLRDDPVQVMQRLQEFLQVSPVVDYSELIEFDPDKGFYCEVVAGAGRTKCLGKGKGRRYEPMDEESARFLKRYFFNHNIKLNKLLKRTGKPVPPWLVHELTSVPSR